MNAFHFAFDRAERLLARLAASQPRVAFTMAASLGAMRQRISRRWPSAEEVRRLFPAADARAIAAAIGGLEARSRVLSHCLRRAGPAPIRELVTLDESFRSLRAPAILAMVHVGALHALGPAMEQLSAPVLSLRHGLIFRSKGALETIDTTGDEQHRAAVFHRSLMHLKQRGFVAIALDVVPGPALEVPCLAHTLRLARGPFALARLTHAPIIPVVARWTRNSDIHVSAFEPLTGADEASLALSAGMWLERYLTTTPREIGLGLLRSLIHQ